MLETGYKHIAFTVCSNNYLAQARTLQESLQATNPEFQFFVALVDEYSDSIDYSVFQEGTIIELMESIVPNYGDMISRYSIIELNTAVKPFVFQYLQALYPWAGSLFYFDPDIFVYHHLQPLLDKLVTDDVLVTPHFLTPVPIDEKMPQESMALNYGIYNLGFIAIKNSSTSAKKLIQWWGERTYRYGYFNTCEGLFVDQLWMNLSTVYFQGVHVLRHKGCNIGPWNLYERTVSFDTSTNRFVMPDQEPLIFYHFSSFSYKNPLSLSGDYNRSSITSSSALQKMYTEYRKALEKNRFEYFSLLSCKLKLATTNPPLKKQLLGPVISLARNIWKRM